MNYKGYLIDLDGTIFRGNELIDGAKEFIDYLIERNYPYLFITNNATYTIEMILKKLNGLGIKADEENILTSAMATAQYIKEKNKQAHCYVIGETGLIHALENEDLIVTDVNCDYVIVGLDRKVTYDKLAKACLLVRDGAQFILTNKDAAIPTEIGLLPGNGSIGAVISYSTGVEPVCIGKPESIIMEEAIKKIGISNKELLMIGDNYHTDIQAGINAQIDTLMVLTGYSTKEDLQVVEVQPTYVMEDLKSWLFEKA
ncbi:TIGR01457 family HAD-type hydrolase [Pseudogracilibacillus sp. SE30717A]|uniref:TIGR01457 family HAD-type hydrolase n=1 Tax=Pseudogracilibacillus sp. SE30717A TaxID=3098293 RepID=UPI00300DC68E